MSQTVAVGELSTPTRRRSTRQRKIQVRRSPRPLYPERVPGYIAPDEQEVEHAPSHELVGEDEALDDSGDTAATLLRAMVNPPDPPSSEECTQAAKKFAFPSPHRPRQPALSAFNASSELWYVRSVQLLVAMLHTQFHVSFRACGALLNGLKIILRGLGVEGEDDVPGTLNTVLSRLEVNDRFHVAPSCGKCHRLYSSEAPPLAMCGVCSEPLFHTMRRSLFQSLNRGSCPPTVPIQAVPIASLKTLLEDFLIEASNEFEVDAWRHERSRPGYATRIMDGKVWQDALDMNGLPFFDSNSLTEPDELRIGLTFSVDW